jgi:ADP-ribose pyrophosphatase YjhB (NUDIX family)
MSLLTSAVAAVITDDAGRVLICQQSAGHRLWGLPGGKIRPAESPIHATVRDIREETGMEISIIDMVGLYQLTGGQPADDPSALPDVLVHVFRARCGQPEATVNSPGRICHLTWADPSFLPAGMMATASIAIRDAVNGLSGVVRAVQRIAEPDIPEAADVPSQPEPVSVSV